MTPTKKTLSNKDKIWLIFDGEIGTLIVLTFGKIKFYADLRFIHNFENKTILNFE